MLAVGLLLVAAVSACSAGSSAARRPSTSTSLPPIAYVQGTNSVYLLYGNGTSRFITTGGGVAWTPDHDELLVDEVNLSRTPPSSEIWLVTSNGKPVLQVTSVYPDRVRFFAAGEYESAPFIAYDTNKTGIQLRNLLTGSQRAIRVDAPVDSLAVSPDGARIAFTANSNKKYPFDTLYVAGTYRETPLKEVLPPNEYRSISDPSWSPDGDWIAATITTFKGVGVSVNGVWLMHSDGTDLHVLTMGSAPHWSPDGQWISYVADKSIIGSLPRVALFKIRSDGTDRTQLSPYADNDSASAVNQFSPPSW